MKERSIWGSKIGFLLAAIGSAIGLGNIWRFSYMAYEHGGGAFLVPYFVALILAGVPLMILEYILGHSEKASSPLAFARVSKGWEWVGWWMPTVALFGIMLYYAVIIGWCINYLFFSLNLSWGADPGHFFQQEFLQISGSPFELGGIRIPIILATFVVWFLCWMICFREINHGIEKASMIFMPLLMILTIVLVAWTLRLDGAWEAIKNVYLSCDWQKINFITGDHQAASKVWVAAFGQIFFTLSLGFGIMITYSSYLPKKTDIVGNALWTTVINCMYSFLAGFAVFGVVGFMAKAKGVAFSDAIAGGPALAFVVYPKAISELPAAQSLFGVMFFLVLILAGISSGISLIEAFTCALIDKFGWKRGKVVSYVCVVGFLGSIIFTTRAGLYILDIADHFITNYGLVMGGLLECLVVGWLLKAKVARKHVEMTGGVRLPVFWDYCVRFITPAILLWVLFHALNGDAKEAYEGYSRDSLITYGVCWLVATLVAAVVFTFYPWKPERLKRDHKPEDETLLT